MIWGLSVNLGDWNLLPILVGLLLILGVILIVRNLLKLTKPEELDG